MNSTSTRLIVTLVLALLAGCTEPKKQMTPGARPEFIARAQELNQIEVRVALTAQRRLELEPCGCTVSDYGGVPREWNVMKEFAKESTSPLYHVYSGATFTPYAAAKKTKASEKHLQLKREALARALKQIAPAALALDADDLATVRATGLAALQRLHGVPVVSADVEASDGLDVRKLIVVKSRTSNIAITAVTHAATAGTALRAVSADARKQGAQVLIVLGATAEADRISLRETTGLPTVFLGGGPDEPHTEPVLNAGKNAAFGAAIARGRGLLLMEMNWNGKNPAGFLLALSEKMGEKPASPVYVSYQSSIVPLSAGFDTPVNAIHKLVSGFKREMSTSARAAAPVQWE